MQLQMDDHATEVDMQRIEEPNTGLNCSESIAEANCLSLAQVAV